MSLNEPMLRCSRGHTVQLALEMQGCPTCRTEGVTTAVELAYPMDAIQRAWAHRSTGASRGLASLEAAGALPYGAAAVSLGEGITPLIPSRIGRTFGRDLWLKLEAFSPTGSYKDRLNAVAVSMATRFGATGMVCSSTGNQGASMAAYAAAAGLPAVVLLPEEAPEVAAQQAAAHGATALITPWDVRPRVIDALLREEGWSLSNRNDPRPWANPFGLDGYRSISFEIVDTLGHAPSIVVMPTCGGDGLYGIWKGFRELRDAGVIDRAPMMIAVQPSVSDSLVQAVESDAPAVLEIPLQRSVALSLTDRKMSDLALRAVRESGGAAVRVTEEEIADAVLSLARTGVYAEPASATSIAALPHVPDTLEGDVVCIVTASGVRWPYPLGARPPIRAASFDAAMAAVRERRHTVAPAS